MNGVAAIAARESRPDCRRLAGRPARWVTWQAAGLIACAILVLAAGGCGPSKFKALTTQAEFEEEVLKADKPVLVDFFKGGCASCMFLEPCMDQLSEEYKDRVTFYKFEGMRFWLEIPCWEVIKRYRIGLYPTVLLFVNGKEKKRWVLNYSGDAYRKVLDEVVGAPPPGTVPPESPAPPDTTKASSQPVAPVVAPLMPDRGGGAPATPARTGELPGAGRIPTIRASRSRRRTTLPGDLPTPSVVRARNASHADQDSG